MKKQKNKDDPEEFPVMTINPLNLTFSDECKHLEQSFLNNYAAQSIKYIRQAFWVGIFFYSIFGILDAIIAPEKKALLWFIRYGVVCPMILGCLLLSFWSGFQKWSQPVIVFVILLAGGGISVMVAVTQPPAAFSYYAGVILVLMLGYGFVRARFIWASLAGWINVIIYEIVAIGIVDTPIPVLVNNNFFFISANIIGMFSCYAFEFYTRKDFFMAQMLSAERKKVTELNRDLEKKVHVRTAELQRTNDKLTQEIKDRESLQAQLVQAQKMESVGRLAGGVAHDFNNILSVIIGFSELAMEKVPPDSPLHEDLKEILTAAGRSRDITHQLLTFARKETISPVVLDLNACVENMLKILRRLIGEDINLTWLPDAHLLPVLMDRSQLEQILANLCINARDAITDVGNITIKTETELVENCPINPVHLQPGQYVLLLISDTGKGMAKETLDNIFEPFFTTKGVGQGTGLGLATVHGIIQQNNGFVKVYSEVEKGTTFKIYLPQHQGEIAVEKGLPATKEVKGNGEHLLVVEDETSILKLARRILAKQGYHVDTAQTPFEALEIAKRLDGDIDLLITDVVMPGMNGKELAEQLKKMNPQIKCIYMSGYTANVIAHRGVLDKGLQFIQKPFQADTLIAAVRAVLDTKDYSIKKN